MSHYDSSGNYVLTRIDHAVACFNTLSAATAAGVPPREVQPYELWMIAARSGSPGANPVLATLTFKRGLGRTADLYQWKSNACDVTLLALDGSGREVARYQLVNAWPSHWLRRATKIDGFVIKQQVLPGAKPGGVNELAMDDTAGAGKIWIEEMSLNYASMRRA